MPKDNDKRALRRYMAVAALGLSGTVALYELTWLLRSGLAWVIVVLAAAVMLLSLAQLVK